MIDVKAIVDLLRDRSSTENARISAFLLGPALVLGLASSELIGGGFSIDAARPMSIVELRTQVSSSGVTIPRAGFALIIEPIEFEYRVPLESTPRQIWTSLNEQSVRANKDRLTLDNHGVSGKAPLLGVTEPVTVVVDGHLGKEIFVPGGAQEVDYLLLESRKSLSIVSSVLLSCIFALGLSAATGFPTIDRD